MSELINNVIFVIDESGSMHHHRHAVESVVRSLADSLKDTLQKTRVSLYTFSSAVDRKLLSSDPQAMSLFNFRPNGQTALIDAVMKAVIDHKVMHVPSYEDHSYLLYVITDGEENGSRIYRAQQLRQELADLPNNWTVAALVPNNTGVHYAKQVGFPAGNIEIWNVASEKGFEDVGRRLADTYQSYTVMRSAGAVATNSLFLNTANLTTPVVKANLAEDTTLLMFTTPGPVAIRPFVELMTGNKYSVGSAFYELTKAETVQAKKELAIVNRKDGKKYVGANARNLLGLPHAECRVRPGDFGDWRIFVQSTSVNRKLPAGATILVR